MKKSDYIQKGLLSASGVFIYILGVSWVLFNAKTIFGGEEPKGFVAPIFMLLLFVVSATITGLLVLGKPIYLYFEGKKKEAFTLLIATLAWLILFLFIVAVALVMQ